MTNPVPKPPRADKRPRVETWHGYEKRDDYHWLKAPNWQEVMHDPSVLPTEIRADEMKMLGSRPGAGEPRVFGSGSDNLGGSLVELGAVAVECEQPVVKTGDIAHAGNRRLVDGEYPRLGNAKVELDVQSLDDAADMLFGVGASALLALCLCQQQFMRKLRPRRLLPPALIAFRR